MTQTTSKTVTVALIEQFGALIVAIASCFMTQHLYCELQHESDRSWLVRIGRRWVTWRLEHERKAYFDRLHREVGAYMTPESVPEPEWNPEVAE